ncbi:MAG TPA: vitamin K epoxide reductase family protein [Patescibacteria group bacterium]
MGKIYLVIKILAIFGIFLAIFLLWEKYTATEFTPCNVNSLINCNAIISGDVSNTFGIPTPIIGLLGYIFILLGAFLKFKKFVFGMATFGLLFCLYIGIVEIIFLHVICPVCILCQLDMTCVWILSIMLLKFNKS